MWVAQKDSYWEAEMNNPETTWLYFHSAVFQGNMALLAFIGVFVVFKLQQISSDLQTQFKNIDTFVRQCMSFDGKAIPVNFHDIPSLKTEINQIAESGLPNHVYAQSRAVELKRDERYPHSIQIFEGTERGRKKIIHAFWYPVGLLSLAILGSLVALPLFDAFTSYYCATIIVFIALSSIAFAANVIYVRFVIGQTAVAIESMRHINQGKQNLASRAMKRCFSRRVRE